MVWLGSGAQVFPGLDGAKMGGMSSFACMTALAVQAILMKGP